MVKNEPVKLSIIIINWNGVEVIPECLESIYLHPPKCKFEVIVWDNASTDDSVNIIEKNYPQVILVKHPKNIGFAKGNNLAAKIASGEYLLLLNSDTVILDNALDTIMAFIDDVPDMGVLGCNLLNADGSLQFSAGRFPNILSEFLDQMMLSRYVSYSKYTKGNYQQIFSPDWITGACMLIKKEEFEKIGGFDESYFMFFEDMDLCKRLRLNGRKIVYYPEAKIIHKKGWSSQTVLGKMIVEDQKSTYRFVRKYYSVWQLFFFRLLAILGSIVRIGYWGVTGLLARNGNAHDRLNAYKQIILRSWADREFYWGGGSR